MSDKHVDRLITQCYISHVSLVIGTTGPFLAGERLTDLASDVHPTDCFCCLLVGQGPLPQCGEWWRVLRHAWVGAENKECGRKPNRPSSIVNSLYSHLQR